MSAERKLNEIKSELMIDVLSGYLDHGEMDEVLSEYYIENGQLCHILADMPFDRDNMHATGIEVFDESNNIWWNQYVDSNGEKYLLN